MNQIFKGVPVLPDHERAQMPQMLGAQGSQSSQGLSPASASESTSSLGKIFRGESRSPLSSYSGLDAQFPSRHSSPETESDEEAETNPSMSTDIIEHLLLAPGKLHLIPWAMS
jgi:hypothetical protein